jgi:2-polyprenyl-3-methyl-5-hydroxy-6-metoxy-1,4-benzoquinol methylase
MMPSGKPQNTDKLKGNRYTGERLVDGVDILKPMRYENQERFRFFNSLGAGGQILDLGCGTGEGSAFLSKDPKNHIIAVDFSYEAVLAAHALYSDSPTHWMNMDGQSLSFKSGSFDAVISIEVIEHIPDPVAYLKEIRRVLRPNGYVMFSTPNKLRSSPTPGSMWPEHLREFTPNELCDLLKSFFSQVNLFGEMVKVYEQHPLRLLIRKIAPWIKPILPHWIRVRGLHTVQFMIKPDLEPGDIVFSQENLDDLPTLIAICKI